MKATLADTRRTAAIAVAYGGGILAFPWLPGPFLEPHSGFALRVALAALLPTVAVVVAWSAASAFGAIEGNAVEASAAALRTVLYAVTCFIVTLHLIVMLTLIGVPLGPVPPSRLALALTGLLLVLVGNCLPRSRPNLAFGIRTRRLLDEPREWARVHRFVGYVISAVGIVTVLAALALPGATMEPVLATTLVVALAAVALSYWDPSHA